jgi:hypothetical protein
MKDPSFHERDVIVLATSFRDRSPLHMTVRVRFQR